MKVNVNIELWDNTPMSNLDEVGLTTKFLETMYRIAFEQLVNEMCSESPGMEHALSIEVVDNTVE